MKKHTISQKYNAIKNSDILTRYNTKKELSLKSKQLLSEILIISQLDISFDKKREIAFIDKKNKDFLSESRKLKFYVTGNRNSTKFVSILKNYLAQNNFNISSNSKNSVIVKINTKDNISNTRATKIAVMNMNISVYDKKQRIGGKTIILKERYNGSKESSYKNASIHLDQDIKSQGIDKVIGIHLDLSK